jgi:hypothetical protein
MRPLLKTMWFVVFIAHLTFVGAKWWAQDFQKSMPLLGWVPFISGMDATRLIIYFLYLYLYLYLYCHMVTNYFILAPSISLVPGVFLFLNTL